MLNRDLVCEEYDLNSSISFHRIHMFMDTAQNSPKVRFSRLDTTSISQHPIVGAGNIDTNLLFLCFCQIELVKEAKSGG